MHFEILVEDQSGKKALDILIPKILYDPHTFRVLSYKGIGKIPKELKSSKDASLRILLDQLPRLLKGYGKAFAKDPDNYKRTVILVCDLDDKCLKRFRETLDDLLRTCNPAPVTGFCIAVEEGESWFFGDLSAIKRAYPKAKQTILDSYQNDSICRTWEKLADAIYQGGSKELKQQGWQAVGTEKSRWAERISPYMDVDRNLSPSFQYFQNKLKELIQNATTEDKA